MAKTNGKMIANNKKAYHDYFILENYEAGIALHGTEVKSLRMGKCSIKEAFIRVENGEVYIYGMHISPYEKGNIFNKDPLRVRKLLLHKSEINKLLGKTKEKGIDVYKRQDYVAIMDVDLQDPPSLLPKMYGILENEEYDSVATKRSTRTGEPKIRSFLSESF